MKVGYVKKVIEKRKRRSSIKRVDVIASKALQQMFLCCRDVFRVPTTVPLPDDVARLCAILDKMKGEDVGLSGDMQFFNPRRPSNIINDSPRVTYTTVYKCPSFSICIFFIPESGVIPLHDHPHMTVFSKLLLGKMHIKSYDWVQPTDEDKNNPPRRLAILKASSVLTAGNECECECKASVLFPETGGNIHSFTAITPCAVLDVIGPPYSKQQGRDCSYFQDYPFLHINNGVEASYAWLQEIDMPHNSHMDWVDYLGPQVVDF